MTPRPPSSRTITTATAAGMSQGGRSNEGPPRDGGRATEGLRAGALIGARGTGGAVGTLGGVWTTATPPPRGSAGTVSPGFQAGVSRGVQGCCGGGAAGASRGGGGAGREVGDVGAGAGA